MRQQRAMAEQPPVGPPEQAQRPPTAAGVGAGVEIGREPEPTDQKGQPAGGDSCETKPGAPKQPERHGQDPGGAVVLLAAGHKGWLLLQCRMAQPPG